MVDHNSCSCGSAPLCGVSADDVAVQPVSATVCRHWVCVSRIDGGTGTLSGECMCVWDKRDKTLQSLSSS